MFEWLKKKEKPKIYSYYGTFIISLVNGNRFNYTIEPENKTKSNQTEQINSLKDQYNKIVELIDNAKSVNGKFETNLNEFIYADKVTNFSFKIYSTWRYDEN